MFQHLAPHQPICARNAHAARPAAAVTAAFLSRCRSRRSAASRRFVLKWLKALQNAHHKQLECEVVGWAGSPEPVSARTRCRGVVSCHVDDDGVFKQADPRALNRFPHHRAVYIVGDPLHAVTSVFRRNFQCWHLYRLHNCLVLARAART